MTKLILFLFFCQVLGAFTGACTAIWGELAHIRAMRDGEIDTAERAHLRVIAHGLRFGMTLLLLSSLALAVVAYALHETLQPALTANYWIFTLLTLLVIGFSWALARRRVSFTFGSAAALTAWWLLAYLTLGRLTIPFGSAVALYVVLTAVIYGLLRTIRIFAVHKR
ncbi:MAG: hypothetical protein WC798_00270 [Candidatus Paceibacterota bacterium]|jgi:hypothetical protein